MTQTLPDVAATLRAIADRIERDDISNDIRISMTIQVGQGGDATPEQRTTAVEAIAATFDGRINYSGDIGHYNGNAGWISVYGRMRPPASLFATMWDEAHAEQDARREALLVETHAAADRIQDWFDAHNDCCGHIAGYRTKMDHEQEIAESSLIAAVDDLDPDAVVITCGRCAIGVGGHTFGVGCSAKLEPVFVTPAIAVPCDCDGTPSSPHPFVAPADHEPYESTHPELFHIDGRDDIAPGEPDERGWDEAKIPASEVRYITAMGATA